MRAIESMFLTDQCTRKKVIILQYSTGKHLLIAQKAKEDAAKTPHVNCDRTDSFTMFTVSDTVLLPWEHLDREEDDVVAVLSAMVLPLL